MHGFIFIVFLSGIAASLSYDELRAFFIRYVPFEIHRDVALSLDIKDIDIEDGKINRDLLIPSVSSRIPAVDRSSDREFHLRRNVSDYRLRFVRSWPNRWPAASKGDSGDTSDVLRGSLTRVVDFERQFWDGRMTVVIFEYPKDGCRSYEQPGAELNNCVLASDVDRFFRRFSGATSGDGRPGGNDYGSYQSNDTESACNRLPVSDLGLALCRFRNAPLLAQIGMILVAGLLTYVPIMLGATILILPERGRRISVAWGLLGFGLICGAVTYGVIFFGLYSAAFG